MKRGRKFLSVALALLMVLSILPIAAMAEETETGTLVTDAGQITGGDKFVIVAKVDAGYKALGTTIGGKIDGVDVTVTDSKVTGTDLPVWTIDATDGGVSLSNGTEYLAYSGSSTNFKADTEPYAWSVEAGQAADGLNTFKFTSVASTNRGIMYQHDDTYNRFGAYSTSNSDNSTYVHSMLVFKLSGGDVDPTPDPDPDPEPTEETWTKITDTASLTDGYYVLVAEFEDQYFAFPSDKTNGRPTGEAITVEGDTIKPDSSLVWAVDAEGTQVSFSNGTSYLGWTSSTSFASSETPYIWNVTAEGGLFRFAASGDARRIIAYSSGPKTFGSYSNANLEDPTYKFDLLVFKSSKAYTAPEPGPDPEPDPEPDTLYKPADGDVVVIYHPNSKMVMTDTDSNGKLAGSAATVADGKLTAAEASELKVKIEDENYIFTNKDGKYLTSGETGNSLSFEDAVSDCGKWTLTESDDKTGWVIENVGAAYEGGKQALEYYSGFTTYGTKTGDTRYIFNFYKNYTLTGSTPTPGGEITDGTYVIWNPTHNKALSSTKTGYNNFYNLGQDVTLSDGKLSGYTDAEIWTVATDSDGNVTISQDGQNIGLADKYTSMDLGAKNDKWKLLSLSDGSFNVQNTGRADQYMQYSSQYSSYQTGPKTEKPEDYELKFYPTTGGSTEPEPGPEPTVPAGAKPENGKKYVIYNYFSGNVMNTTMRGSTAVMVGDHLLTDGTELILTAEVSGEVYKFKTDDGRYLGLPSGTVLYVTNPGENYEWELTKEVNGGWIVKNNSDTVEKQYIEYYNNSFTNYYAPKGDDTDIYAMMFVPAEIVLQRYKVDETLDEVEAIAAWGGGGIYDDYESSGWRIPGDLFTTNDMKDENAHFTAVVSGVATRPVPDGKSPYMGGVGLGSGTDDYMQFELSTAGWGHMTMGFRMRLTGSSPYDFQLQYSVDGETFMNFTTGTYTCSYTDYSGGGEPVASTNSGSISDGKAANIRTSEYATYTFDVPAGAENAERVLIRMVPNTARTANGKDGKPSTSNNVRLDSITIKGYPIDDSSITPYVTVTPDDEEAQPAGTELTLTCADSNAKIFYRFDGVGEYVEYNANAKPKLASLPANLQVYAKADGKDRSVVRTFNYIAGRVSAVKMSPNGGGVYMTEGSTKTVTLTCDTEGATINYTTYKGSRPGEITWETGTSPVTITLEYGFNTMTIEAYATKAGLDDSSSTVRTFTQRAEEEYKLYFGQMHSHTSYSDGSGTAESAYKYVDDLDQETWNMDFLSVTDHSNSFDKAGGSKTINDTRDDDNEWTEGKKVAAAATNEQFVGIFGYEMTWSNGLGHINTFNTTGYQDRTQSDYTTYSTALQNYYAALKTAPASISQFNHPGTTFGDFSDFAHYDPEIDELITLIEVGNGEGAIGSSGYFPSYEYYTRALDKGWHVAPTNNQDNHKGGWGTANTGRDVVLVDELTEDAIYDAMRNYRVYATEDLNLEIYYTFDGNIMGSILDADSYQEGDTAMINLKLKDPNDTEDATIEVIVNGGKSLKSTKAKLNGTVEIEVPTNYNYYYIKITQADGDIAVTAPVWIGKVEAIGVTQFTAEGAMTISGQPQNFNIELYNNESKKFDVNNITVTDESGKVIWQSSTAITVVRKMNTASCSFTATLTESTKQTLTVTVNGVYDGDEKTYTKTLEVNVVPSDLVTHIVVDGSHYNDYVAGYYGGNMGNMTAIAANNAVNVTIADRFDKDTLKNCDLLVISAPGKAYGTANAGDYKPSSFEPDFIDLVKEYVDGGGTVILCGLADFQDKIGHTSVEMNKILTALNSTMAINDDEVYDKVNNGGQEYRLYPEIFNMDSPWTRGIITKDSVGEGEMYQTYSQYSGCTVDPGNGTWIVKGFDTTYSIDSDKDGKGGVQEGEAYFMACEDTGKGGTIFVAGGVFLSDFEVAAEMDNQFSLPYANRTIFENIMGTLCTPSSDAASMLTVAEARKQPKDSIYMTEGYVTNGTTDVDTTFFDAIYIQDDTAGITCFPYASTGLEIGTKVRILGYADEYQGDKEIQIISIQVLNEDKKVYDPTVLTTKDAHDYDANGGLLVKTTGVVSNIVISDGKVSQFDLTDYTKVPATIFIDGYIWNADHEDNVTEELKDGMVVTAVGLSYLHPEGDKDVSVPVLRVRNMDEIELNTELPVNPNPGPGGGGGGGTLPSVPGTPSTPGTPSEPTEPTKPTEPTEFPDIPSDAWYLPEMGEVIERGLFKGDEKGNFNPDMKITRGQLMTLLARLNGVDTTGSDPWYKAGMDWAVGADVSDGTAPEGELPREQFVTMLYRYIGSPEVTGDLSGYPDGDKVSDWAVNAMIWAVQNGIVKGNENGELIPGDVATRSQAAVILERFIKAFEL